MDSPGGWQLIGRTPYRLFKSEQAGRPLYEAGDSIRFVPISQEEFEEISRKQEKG
ncbi:Kinase A inhibitor [compost metagenome]